jgi:esterase/lipase superfamily enzyme
MNREYHCWESRALQRKMELLVFGHAGPRMLVFPSRKQRFYEYEDRGMIAPLRARLEGGKLQLICVDSLDAESLYCFEKTPEERIQRHLQFERYVLEDVLPFSGELNAHPALSTHGCSFGAYHAMAIALRHPEHFQRVLAFSGRYDLTLDAGHYHNLFHGFYDDSLYYLMPSHFVPNLHDPGQLSAIRRLRFSLVIGEDDPFYADNLALSRAFTQKRIHHELHTWSGNAHRFRDWRQMAPIYF